MHDTVESLIERRGTCSGGSLSVMDRLVSIVGSLFQGRSNH